MPKRAKELTASAVAKLKEPGRYPVGGVDGLQLRITDAGTRLWICRITVNGVRRDIGLGYYEDVTLSQARDEAREKHRSVRLGLDLGLPAVGQRPTKPVAIEVQKRTFKAVAIELIESKRDGWRNGKHVDQWRNTLETYAYPVMGDMDVAEVGLQHVLDVLRPIWGKKTETATRLRGRIESILGYAFVHGWRTGDNPAQWRGLLDKVLPAPEKVRKREHFASMPVDDVPAFMARLAEIPGAAAQALRLLILTAVRSGEVFGARWAEFDMVDGVWTVPAERMKAGVEHRVPLSRQVLALLSSIPRIEGSELVFPSARGDKPISNMSMTMLMRREKLDYVPHGFRSTFRDWAGDFTEYPRDILEAALAHTVGNKVEAAYRRKDALERRRPLMQDWADLLEP
ncbi:MAG: integrase arm-type DNA-binding domain-containing protein [Acidovorax sp.]|jgi:integrase|nr:integrase arm-type DNA-binding domain-containing protein [Acidovorax sp.]